MSERTPAELLRDMTALVKLVPPEQLVILGDDGGKTLARHDGSSYRLIAKGLQDGYAELFALAPAVAPLLEAAVMVMADVECYCLDEQENLGRGPCARCQAGEALRVVDTILGKQMATRPKPAGYCMWCDRHTTRRYKSKGCWDYICRACEDER